MVNPFAIRKKDKEVIKRKYMPEIEHLMEIHKQN